MDFIQLSSIKNKYFYDAWRLYEESFPIDERRELESQIRIMNHLNYNFEAIIIDTELIGLIAWWNFYDLRFLDHFAIKQLHRGKGIGTQVLETFKNLDTLPIILEVDIPDKLINQRRIEFYEKAGFNLNKYSYQQPPLRKEGKSVALLTMSYPEPFFKKDINHFIKNYHPIIYQIM